MSEHADVRRAQQVVGRDRRDPLVQRPVRTHPLVGVVGRVLQDRQGGAQVGDVGLGPVSSCLDVDQALQRLPNGDGVLDRRRAVLHAQQHVAQPHHRVARGNEQAAAATGPDLQDPTVIQRRTASLTVDLANPNSRGCCPSSRTGRPAACPRVSISSSMEAASASARVRRIEVVTLRKVPEVFLDNGRADQQAVTANTRTVMMF